MKTAEQYAHQAGRIMRMYDRKIADALARNTRRLKAGEAAGALVNYDLDLCETFSGAADYKPQAIVPKLLHRRERLVLALRAAFRAFYFACKMRPADVPIHKIHVRAMSRASFLARRGVPRVEMDFDVGCKLAVRGIHC